MMHPARERYRDYLLSKLGNATVIMDRGKGLWDTARRAWLAYDKEKDYHLVIQDDAIIGDNFIERVDKILTSTKYAYNLYFGKRRSRLMGGIMHTGLEKGYVVLDWLCWALGIVLPSKLIDEMVSFGDKIPIENDDTKIKRFLRQKRMNVYYPVPSLLNHRPDIFSLVEKKKNKDRQALYFIDDFIIPKKIHQIWIGSKERPKKWMDTWKEKNPGWEYILWDEKTIRNLPLRNEELFNRYKQRGIIYGMADVARAEILLKEGGIYIDADCECLETLEGADFMEAGFFSVYANKKPELPGRIANGVIGSVKNHPILRKYVEAMGRAREIMPPWNTIGGTLLTKCINNFGIKEVRILPPHYFYPESSWGYKYQGADKIYARHYWAQTKKLY